jgi:hypothetical protein
MDIGFQLYSARNYPLAMCSRMLGRWGKQVEGFGGVYGDPEASGPSSTRTVWQCRPGMSASNNWRPAR